MGGVRIMLKNKKGFTLIELVVVLALLTMLSGILTGIMMSVFKVNNTSTDLSFAQIKAQYTLERIVDQIKYASAVDIQSGLPGTFGEDTYYLSAESGFIKAKSSSTDAILSPDPIDPDFAYSVTFAKENAKVVAIDVSVWKNGSIIYSAQSSVFVNNLSLNNITGAASGNCIAFKTTIQTASSGDEGDEGDDEEEDIKISTISLSTSTGSTSLKYKGNTMTIIADISPANATNKTITWSVNNTSYATIDSNGVLTSGTSFNKTVIVTAQSNDGSGVSQSITISITK